MKLREEGQDFYLGRAKMEVMMEHRAETYGQIPGARMQATIPSE